MKSWIWLFVLVIVAGPAAAELPDLSAVFARIAKQGGGAQPTYVRLIEDNHEAWFARWWLIENTHRRLDCTYFMFEPDIWGKAFLGLILKKARAGVKVRLLLDSKGVFDLTRFFLGRDFLQELSALPNVEVRAYNPPARSIVELPAGVRPAVASSHDKILVNEDGWVITGGRNIGSLYFASHTDDPRAWWDTDVLLRGSTVATSARIAFEAEWERHRSVPVSRDLLGNWKSRSRELELARRAVQSYMLGLPVPAADGELGRELAGISGQLAAHPALAGGYASFTPYQGERLSPAVLLDRVADGRDGVAKDDIGPSLVALADAARHEIVIQNPYVVLTTSAREALVRAAQRGVKILLHTNSPASTDSYFTQAMFLLDWKELMRDAPTLRIFANRAGKKMHSKVFVFDGRITVVGTYNLDPLSAEVNSELVAVVDSTDLSVRTRTSILGADVKDTVEYQIAVQPDGTIRELVGPSDHTPPEVMKAVQKRTWFRFLRAIF